MPWFEHPSFSALRQKIIAQHYTRSRFTSRLRPIVFLCGGAGSDRRTFIDKFIRQSHPDFLVFYADDVWKTLSGQVESNALKMEELLAQLSDVVIIVVESPGTFAEIGAFSLSEPLRSKLLPILESQFRDSSSFLNSGPIRWVDAESCFAPSIWVPHKTILRCGEELSERLGRIPKPKATKIDDLATSPKHLLFLLRDLVAIFGPSSPEHVVALTRTLVSVPAERISTLLAVAEAMQLLSSQVSGSKRYYLPAIPDGHLQAYMRKKYLDISQLRMQVVGVLQSIPSAREAMRP